MNTKLTLSLDKDIIERAKIYARNPKDFVDSKVPIRSAEEYIKLSQKN